MPDLRDVCATCGETWGEHYGSNCDNPATDRKWISRKSSPSGTIGRKIPEYPKICKLCDSPVYLGLNEVIHDPNWTNDPRCPGRVDT